MTAEDVVKPIAAESAVVDERRAIGHLGVKIEAYHLREDGPWMATCRRRDEQGQNRWPDGDKTAFDKIPCHLPAKALGREKQFPADAAGKRVNRMLMYLINKSFFAADRLISVPDREFFPARREFLHRRLAG
jgi:hypothetical protein